MGCTREEGFAGKLFREMLERQRLYVASGRFRELPTFHGTQGNTSTIDFVVLPQSYAEFVRAATVLGKSGRQLQHARVRRPLDHDPVMIRFEYAPDFFRPAKKERPPLDMDLLGLSMTTGYRRAEFMARVERETEEALRQHPPHATMTDHKWQDVVEILQRSAAEFFAQGPLKEQMDGYKELIQERENYLMKRRTVRNRLASWQQRGQLRGAESGRESAGHTGLETQGTYPPGPRCTKKMEKVQESCPGDATRGGGEGGSVRHCL